MEAVDPEYTECEVNLDEFRKKTPGSLFHLARENFDLEFGGIKVAVGNALRNILDAAWPPKQPRAKGMPDCMGFVLDDEAVRQKDLTHEAAEDEPALIRWAYNTSVWGLDLLYEGKPIQRFWVLEVIARVPYFSYVSVLHFYESMGWWQNTDLSKVHFAEAYAEQHHLLIMEALGGNNRWFDRFIAQHTAIAYYWAIVFLYWFSPKWSYYFMQLVEQHAADTEDAAALMFPTLAQSASNKLPEAGSAHDKSLQLDTLNSSELPSRLRLQRPCYRGMYTMS
ncbi:hypothetical protein CYMTET_26375 [Cymbomonas tetramitiformis]|uniref:Ubiquinol oxidase n=1 Tax=Cymbomonas tetramitiformis TaxID=36881 RepID=A0AAE0FRU1_9CHLO|nr:hypothetical protein CYMTET_26375 [Cymbomonas tetramitiformis]